MVYDAPDYKIRIEPFGSLIYKPKDATTITLDREETRYVLGYRGDFPVNDKGIMAPKVVHLELTHRCNKTPPCDYCYVPLTVSEEKELDTDSWKLIMDELSNAGVFQVTFGGGEPSLRGDLFELAHYCKNTAKMNLGMTTNGIAYQVHANVPTAMGLFDQVNVSYHLGYLLVAITAIRNIDSRTKTGINVIIREPLLPEILSLVAQACKNIGKRAVHGIPEILLLAFKPRTVEDIPDMLPNNKIMELAHELRNEWDIPVAVDGYSCGRCEGGYSFCDISSTGEVYPCSFVRESYGNILEESFLDIWNRMPRINDCPFD